MQHNRFSNVCLVLIVALLVAIALRRDVTPAYAADRFSYEVIRVDESSIAAKVAQETDAGWEPVAAPMWAPNFPAQGVVIFRKPK